MYKFSFFNKERLTYCLNSYQQNLRVAIVLAALGLNEYTLLLLKSHVEGKKAHCRMAEKEIQFV